MTSSTHVVHALAKLAKLALSITMVYVRVRLRFDSSPLNYAKKCWFVFDADQCSLVKDVAYLIARQFDLNQGIQVWLFNTEIYPMGYSSKKDTPLLRKLIMSRGIKLVQGLIVILNSPC